MNRHFRAVAVLLAVAHAASPTLAAANEPRGHASQIASVPQPDRAPAPTELLNESERDEARLRHEREFTEAKRTVIIENRLGEPFQYGVFASSGSQTPVPYELSKDRAHRFIAPAGEFHPRLASLSPAGANGCILVAYEQANVAGRLVFKLQANKRYAAVKNTNGFIELVQVDVIKQISRDEISVRIPDIRVITTPGTEAKRIKTLDANLCREPAGRYKQP